jgi:protein-tyrosine-phosphatase
MKVLFVCSGNAHRSPLAAALLKKLKPDVVVDSAGIRIAIPIAEEVRAYLATKNAEQYLKSFPEPLTSKRLEDYDVIIAMQQRHKIAVATICPSCEEKTVVWDIEDPYSMTPEDRKEIYMQIEEKVKELAKTL